MKLKLYLTLILSFFFLFENFAQDVTRGPYLQLGTPNSMIIRWRTNSPTNSKVWYGSNPNVLISSVTNSVVTTEHEVKITGLTPNTTYYYAVGSASGQLAGANSDHYFKTSPVSGSPEPTSIWVLGDAGVRTQEQRDVRNAFYNYNGHPHADAILLLGDNAYESGTEEEYQYALFEDMYETSLINSVMWSTFGNHDAISADSDTESGTYYDIFNFPRDGEAGGVPSGTEAYFSFDYANVHFISLNSHDVDRSETAPMYAWLQADLAANTQQWTVAFFHNLLYYNEGESRTDDMLQIFAPVLEAGGVDLVLYGHRHSYQRSWLINGNYGTEGSFDDATMTIHGGDGRPDGDGAYEKPGERTPNSGTVYMLTGSAGKGYTPRDVSFMPFISSGEKSGSVHIAVNDSQMDVKFIDRYGLIGDYFSITKSAGTNPSVNITSPADGTSFQGLQTIGIIAEASDPDGQLSQIEFFANGASIGTDASAPYSLNWTPPVEGVYTLYAIATDDEGNTSQSSDITIEVGIFSTCSSISGASDDAEQVIGGGTPSLTSSDLELGRDAQTQLVGLRFLDLNIPENVQIVSAELQFTVDENTNINPCDFDIYGEATTNPLTFSAMNDVIGRTRTQTSVSWSPPEWTQVGQAGTDQKVDITEVVQEIVNQNGFSAASPIAIILEGAGKRVAQSFDKDPTKAPSICIVYTEAEPICEGIGDSDNDGVCDNEDICNGGDDNIDADSDGVPDFCDACPDSATDDSDDDGVCDDVDLCAGGDDNIDADSDGVPDFCDACPYSATDDSDNDGVCDDVDQCLDGDDLIDSDMDGLPDACDPCPDSATNLDDDNDGVCNDADICPDGDDHMDSDSDDIPDACDACPNSATGDSDNDGVCDDLDQCPGGDDSIDSDSDGLPDACDTCDNATIGTACDDGDPNTINDRIDADCNCAGTSLAPEILEIQVANSDDDVEERESDGRIYATSSDLELIVDGSKGNQTVGLRFNNIAIPPGAAIEQAYVQFTADETFNALTSLVIEGDASDNALAFRSVNYDVSSRSRTNASVGWSPPAWNTVNERGINQRTADISAIIQEIIGYSGWTSGNSIVIILTGDGKRTAESYDGSPSQAATLHIEYQEFNCDLTGQSCDDGDACTTGDVYDSLCNCAGTFQDSDADGVCDNDDDCPNGDDNIDSDNDGTPDACDDCPGADTGDDDNDGVCNSADQCPGYDDSADADVDGAPDACDICANGDDSIDSDADGTPDACDACPNSATGDSDKDGVCDNEDQCPGGDDSADADADNIPDACDTCDDTTIGDPCDDGDPDTLNDVIDANCVCAGQPNAPIVLDVQVSAGSDDAEERESGGRVSLTSSDLELVYDGAKGNQTVGVRFNNISVPAGSSIQNAYIQFTTDETFSAGTSLFVEGQAIDNAPTFTSASYNISERARTNASVSWNPPAWNSVGERGLNQRTSDISTIVQEIISRPGWVDGNSIVLIITGSNKRTAESYEGNPSEAATLHIEYYEVNCDLTGQPCNDGDSCTSGDVYDSLCNCTGTFQDSDSDGVCDMDDVCPNGDDNMDSDGDGTPDACDDCPGADTGDDDSDGVCNSADQCPGHNDADDDDADGTPDGCDDCDDRTIGDACDDGDPDTLNDVIGADCVCAGASGAPIILDVPVSDGNDDAEERESDGRMYLTSTDLELVNDGNKGNQTVGIRFNNISVPAGASVQNAYIQFTADETFDDQAILLIEGQADNNSPAFSTTNYNISSRTRTNASADWTPPAWTVKNERGFSQRTADISTIIEEIVSLPGWNSGNSIAIIITGTGKRTAESYDGSAAQAASLHIEYLSGSASARVSENARELTTPLIERDNHSIPKADFDFVEDLAVEVKPNPFRDEFYLFIQQPGLEKDIAGADVHIMNINGRLIYQAKDVPFEENHLIVSPNRWPRGLYFVRVRAGEYVKTTKLLKQ